MLVVKRLSKFGREKPGSVATLGVFDGLHRGHMAIIRRLTATAKKRGHDSVVVTFDPPPQLVLSKLGWPGALTSLAEKEMILERTGVDVLAVIRFTPEVAGMSPEDFVKKILVEKLRVSQVICGSDCGFGRGRSGDLTALIELGRRFGFEVTEVRPLKVRGRKIGSTAIKQALRRGDVELAERLLGRPYAISGSVVKGQGLGRKLGFPTVNIKPQWPGQLIPANGVYASSAVIGRKTFPGLLYIGTRPTLSRNGSVSIEFHSLQKAPPNGARKAEARLLRRLRPERRFESLGDLRKAMERDAGRARRWLGRKALAC